MGERFISAHSFRAVSISPQGENRKTEKFTSWQPGSRKKEINGEARTRYRPQGCTSCDLLPNSAPPPTFHHLPIIPRNYESITGLIHSLCQTLITESSMEMLSHSGMLYKFLRHLSIQSS
jgi:hypothetical protein